ncbi:MAG: cobalamin B12-binding domain-containing protein [Phycisphaerae bacterium]|nr:cobalamin B12-binding domain-containing protein [Gemmatimonadaceae bacterium]
MPEAERVQLRPNNLEGAFAARPSKPVVIMPLAVSPLPPPRTLECEIRPASTVAADTVAPVDPLVKEFVRVALATDESEIKAFVDAQLAAGISVQSIYLDLLAPAARKLGELWDQDSCDFVDVTMAVGRLQLVLRDLSQMFVRDRPEEELAGRVLLACVPGEQHSLGLFMVAEFFVRDGWEVHVGPPLTNEQLLADVRSEWYDIVGFSVSCDSRLDHLKREIRRVRQASLNRDVLILAGGRAFNEHPGLLERIGADASAANAELAPERARQLLAK